MPGRFDSIKTNKLDMARYREPNRDEMNISINDALKLQAMFGRMMFPQLPEVMIQGDLSVEDMQNIDADFDYPIDVRVKFPGSREFIFAAEVARKIDHASNWRTFMEACHYYYPNNRLDESSDFIGIAFQHWPGLENQFIAQFNTFRF